MTAELNKFKRRVIRSVAKFKLSMGEDTAAEDKMWDSMQAKVGCDCRLLWQRMRTLTLKKMKRLLPADDRLEGIAVVAQMNLTDWLLFDLVLVHEDIDVISEDPKSKSMKDLMDLVQSFEIEGKRGSDLATAWTAATFHYNSFGRQCSPMLLQRRWYQLKKATREKFYNFWYNYRGNFRLLKDAMKIKPNSLHSIVAQRYPQVVTKPFLEWEELIKEKFVILPDEFEAEIRSKTGGNSKPNKSEPDLLIVEPNIETIDLGVDSDNESDLDGRKKGKQDPKILPSVKIKQEKVDDLSEVGSNNTQELLAKAITEDNKLNDSLMQYKEEDADDELEERPEDTAICDDIEEQNEVEINEEGVNELVVLGEEVKVINNVENKPKIVGDIEPIEEDVEQKEENILTHVISADENTIEETIDDDITMLPTCEVSDNFEEQIVLPQITSVFGNVTEDVEAITTVSSIEQSPKQVEIPDTKCNSDPEVMEIDVIVEETNVTELYSDKGPEKHNDTETVNDMEKIKNQCVLAIRTDLEDQDKSINKDIKSNANVLESIGSNMSSDINLVDDGIELVDDGIEFMEEDDMDLTVVNDSPETENSTPKFDLKLLMQPIVYTTKLDKMNVFKDKTIDCVYDGTLLETALKESKPELRPTVDSSQTEEEPDKEDTEDTSSDSEDPIPEKNRVKLSSCLLQKPRSRSYNPIQLCKNPDFNTRLKRLTVGFLSSMRNRSLLKTLKPMTIDVSKAFESKLVDGTIYLKCDEPLVKREVEVDESASAYVMPSAMPVQSLIDNTRVNLVDLVKPTPIQTAHKIQDLILMERQKTINLPDINHVRRINQQLLTAEVSPMRINPDSDPFKPPVQLVMRPNALVYSDNDNKQINESAVKGLNEKNERIIDKLNPTTSTGPSVAPRDDNAKPSNIADKSKTQSQYVIQRLPGYRIKPARGPALPWHKRKQLASVKDDALLTLDTLNKMLHLVNHNNNADGPNPAHKPHRRLKKKMAMKKNELIERMKQYEDKIENPNIPPTNDESTTTDKDIGFTEEIKTKPCAKVKVNIVKDKPFAPYCCWARLRLSVPGQRFLKKHTCPRLCECCCRHELVKAISNKNTSEIVISDDEEQESVSATIERVVKGSEPVKDGAQQTDPPEALKTKANEISIQCELGDETLTAYLSEENEIASKNIMLPKIIVKRQAKSAVKKVVTNIVNQTNAFGTSKCHTSKHSLQEQPQIKVRSDVMQDQSTLKETPEGTPKVHGHIIIDARKKLSIYSKKVSKEKLIFLRSKMPSAERGPIYLGKDLILLTDVKYPNNLLPVKKSQDTKRVTLPAGVQLELLPNGQVTYVIQPGVKFSDTEMAALPGIIEAVVQQLVASGIPLVNSQPLPINTKDIINLTDSDGTKDDTEQVTEPNQAEIENRLVSEVKEQVSANKDTVVADDVSTNVAEKNKTVTEVVIASSVESITNNNCFTDNENTLNDKSNTEENRPLENSNVINIDTEQCSLEGQTSHEASKDCELQESTSQQNNDDKESQKVATELTSNRKSLLSDLMAMSGIWDDIQDTVEQDTSATSIAPEPPVEVLQAGALDVPAMDLQMIPQELPPVKLSNTYLPRAELTPITSFAQLKYACSKQANFYKLDLTNGTIVHINVGIKEKIRKMVPIRRYTKSVIDLTEEDDDNAFEISELPEPETITKRSLLKVNNPSIKARPMKLFRSVVLLSKKGGKTEKRAILLPTENKFKIGDKRKQVLGIRRHEHEASSECDSSDDEPLANKAKRMRLNENSVVTIENDPNIAVEDTVSAEQEALENDTNSANKSPVQDNVVNFIPDVEVENEDCILGV